MTRANELIERSIADDRIVYVPYDGELKADLMCMCDDFYQDEYGWEFAGPERAPGEWQWMIVLEGSV